MRLLRARATDDQRSVEITQTRHCLDQDLQTLATFDPGEEQDVAIRILDGLGVAEPNQVNAVRRERVLARKVSGYQLSCRVRHRRSHLEPLHSPSEYRPRELVTVAGGRSGMEGSDSRHARPHQRQQGDAWDERLVYVQDGRTKRVKRPTDPDRGGGPEREGRDRSVRGYAHAPTDIHDAVIAPCRPSSGVRSDHGDVV